MNIYKEFLLFFSCLFCLIGVAQNKNKIYLENADCENAIFLEDSVFGPFNYHGGHGVIQEFNCKDTNSFYSFSEEHNSAWYQIEAEKNGFLYLDIISSAKKNDDINFLIYDCVSDSICSYIINRTIMPIRSNLAENNEQKGYSTGLDLTVAESYVKKGQSNVYSQSIEVQQGHQYTLVIDHESKSHTGHQIKTHYFTKAHNNTTKEFVKKEDHVTLTVNTFNTNTNEPMDIDLEISGITPRKPYIVENTHHYTYIIEKFRKYQINCIYKGFMLYSGEYIAPKDSNIVTLNLKLEPITKGAKVSLYNIRFKPNTSNILQSSEAELITLYKFLEKNPTVKIKVIGHVNAPGQKNTGRAKAMSKTRAKSVAKYLIESGIKSSNVKFSGKGNAEMVYAKPTTHEQERVNRRVEIEITDY